MAVPRHATSTPEPSASMAGLLRAPRTALAEEQVLGMPPGAPFLLKHHWSAWEVASEGLDGPQWLPKLKKHVIRPGINHVHTLKRGQASHEAYQDGVEIESRAGWTFIQQHPLDEDHRPAGVPEGPYVREVDVRDPRTGTTGQAYLEAWQVPLPTLPGDEAGQRFRFDRASYNRWRFWLVESGQIAKPPDHVTKRIATTYDDRVAATQTKQWPTTDMAATMTAKAKAIADLHAKAEVPDAPDPEPPPPPRRRAKAGA